MPGDLQTPFENAVATSAGPGSDIGGPTGGWNLPGGQPPTTGRLGGIPPAQTTFAIDGAPGQQSSVPEPGANSPGTIPTGGTAE